MKYFTGIGANVHKVEGRPPPTSQTYDTSNSDLCLIHVDAIGLIGTNIVGFGRAVGFARGSLIACFLVSKIYI